MKNTGTDFGDVRSSGGTRRPRPEDVVDLFEFPAKKWVTMRIVTPVFLYAGSWVRYRDKEGNIARKPFYSPSPAFDPQSQQFDSTIFDPYRAYSDWEYNNLSKEDRERGRGLVKLSRHGYACAIIRALERQRPERLVRPTQEEMKSGFKDKESDTWTPVRAVRFTKGTLEKIKTLSSQNVIEVKGQSRVVSIAHPKYGVDVKIMYDPDRAPADQYTVSLSETRTPLSEAQSKYFLYDLSELETPDPESELRSGFERWVKTTLKGKIDSVLAKELGLKRAVSSDADDGGDGDGGDDYDAPQGRQRAPARRGGRSAPADDGFDGDDQSADGDGDSGEFDGDGDGFDDAPPPANTRRGGRQRAPARRGGRNAPAADAYADDQPADDGGEFADDGGEFDGDGDSGEFDGDGFDDAPPEPARRGGRQQAPARRAAPVDEFADGEYEDGGDGADGTDGDFEDTDTGEDWSEDASADDAPAEDFYEDTPRKRQQAAPQQRRQAPAQQTQQRRPAQQQQQRRPAPAPQRPQQRGGRR